MRWLGALALLALHGCRVNRPAATPELLCSRDEGATWESAGPPRPDRYNLYGVYVDSEGGLFAVGDVDGREGWIFHRPRGDHGWREHRVPGALKAVWGQNGVVWAVGDRGLVIRFTGGVPTPISTGGEEFFSGVWGSSSDHVYVVGTGGVLHTRDGGGSWLKFPTTATMSAVWGSGPEHVFVVGNRDTVLHSTDGGASWTQGRTGTGADLLGIWGRSARELFALGEHGVIARSADGGVTWSPLASGSRSSLWAGATSAGRLFVVAENGAILRSLDGQTWSVAKAGDDYRRRGIWAAPGGPIYVAGRTVPRLPQYNIK